MDQKTEACSRDGDRQSTRQCARCPASQAWALRQGILEPHTRVTNICCQVVRQSTREADSFITPETPASLSTQLIKPS